ncbi:MAG: Holliday junction branch migration protein RuvA [Candidatus Colwellbacteria bacterium]|nr:Holliday junction branch migration protein RuvA [Candidatus Colwellbacteria bacterium]
MIHSISGILKERTGRFIIIEASGFEFKIAIPLVEAAGLPQVGEPVKVFTFLHLSDDGARLYGFLTEAELELFEALISVSGVGPKSALAILGTAPVEQLLGAIASSEAGLLERSSGIGRRTAERIIVELKDKVRPSEGGMAEMLEKDVDILEALIGLGYTKRQAQAAIKEIDPGLDDIQDRMRDALKKIKR